MSRRTAVIEEFDDDTDLPLPSRPLPNTGTRGAILQEVSDDEDEDDILSLSEPSAGPASPSQPQFKPPSAAERAAFGDRMVTDITPYKQWTCIYPIYIDAKRPCSRGERRIARSKSVWFPLSKDIADVSTRLGLGTLHEVNKSHPRDWENPGRVRVQWKKDGRLMHPKITSKKQLLEQISLAIQTLKPDNIPKPPYNTTEPTETSTPAVQKPTTPAVAKGKQPAVKVGGKTTLASAATASISPPPTTAPNRQPKLPVPPAPLPPLTSRVSAYSPALPSGVLIEAVKAGMNAQEAGGPAIGGPGGGKGKRKVVRVRG